MFEEQDVPKCLGPPIETGSPRHLAHEPSPNLWGSFPFPQENQGA